MGHTACACPGGCSSLGRGWRFIILFMVVSFLYLGIGILFQHKVKGKPLGFTSIPNLQFWQSLPGLVKDGCYFTRGLLKIGFELIQQKDKYAKRDEEEYAGLLAENEEEAESLYERELQPTGTEFGKNFNF